MWGLLEGFIGFSNVAYGLLGLQGFLGDWKLISNLCRSLPLFCRINRNFVEFVVGFVE
jgi:hypothetical protein